MCAMGALPSRNRSNNLELREGGVATRSWLWVPCWRLPAAVETLFGSSSAWPMSDRAPWVLCGQGRVVLRVCCFSFLFCFSSLLARGVWVIYRPMSLPSPGPPLGAEAGVFVVVIAFSFRRETLSRSAVHLVHDLFWVSCVRLLSAAFLRPPLVRLGSFRSPWCLGCVNVIPRCACRLLASARFLGSYLQLARKVSLSSSSCVCARWSVELQLLSVVGCACPPSGLAQFLGHGSIC